MNASARGQSKDIEVALATLVLWALRASGAASKENCDPLSRIIHPDLNQEELGLLCTLGAGRSMCGTQICGGISWCFYDNDNNNRTGARPIRSPDSLGMKGQFPLGKQPRPARVLVKSEADLGWRLEKGDGDYTAASGPDAAVTPAARSTHPLALVFLQL